MRERLRQTLQETWYGDRKPGPLLAMLERCYRAGFHVHQAWQRRRLASDLQRKPIVVVGNLSVGGSGKTPFVIRLCELAREAGLEAGVISRGYGRSGRGPHRVQAADNAYECGDEPLLVARRTGVPVQVDEDREAAARTLFDEGVDLVISDDGLQRASLPRRIEICIRDRTRGYGNGRVLPAGPLREPVSRLERVDYIVEHLAYGIKAEAAEGLAMQLRPGVIKRLHGQETTTVAALSAQQGTLRAMAGIANPERFFDTLSRMGLKFERHPFPDHHRYARHDFEAFARDDIILMTEKDAVKCHRMPLFNAWYLPVSAWFSEPLEAALKRELHKMAVACGKRDP